MKKNEKKTKQKKIGNPIKNIVSVRNYVKVIVENSN